MPNQLAGSPKTKHVFSTKPNILLIMVDQQRYPPVYENEELRIWRKKHLKAQNILAENGFTFKNHYTGSTACCPSRATIYTGQYPSLHGVTQTDGAAKGAYDPDIFWLDPNTVPTMGDYFRAAGYQTYWKGKWHASAADILIPGTKTAYLTYNPDNGVPIPAEEERYLRADVLNAFGFSSWVGPEPHGANPRNSGSSAANGVSGRDVVYAEQTVALIRELDLEYRKKTGHPVKPWFIVSSFVNPHDIAIFGAISRASPTGQGGTKEIWKYSRYFANPQFQTVPGRPEQFPYRGPVVETFNPGCQIDPPNGKAIPDQYEMYNLNRDPLEIDNLVHHPTPVLKQIRAILAGLLWEQCQKKRLYPGGGLNPPGIKKRAG
ncbi:sulfatase-like hydrolase/transferase [Hydrogenispora sp. UU3]|uniref:Sulfatase-like hydrolase/transferase n=1 Tax=Capillibacterium thermochitinicola TaxID=2699427 RepID=A0A8J6LRT8_9FIRM|nr:sulfatase-like hydrolase/transferase [Capillibacterium thermochitinicola]